MLVSDEVLFIHAPKTGGSSVEEYLVRNLPGPKVVFLQAARQPTSRREKARNVMRRISYVDASRHLSLPEAVTQLGRLGRSLEDFRLVLGVIRNPYDLEVSRFAFYAHPPRPHKGLTEIAESGDFDRFCREAAYPWGLPTPVEAWYTLDGQVPPNMRLLRFEHLAEDLRAALAPMAPEKHPLPHLNASAHDDWRRYVTAANEPVLYAKYRWLFGFYDRARFGADVGPP